MKRIIINVFDRFIICFTVILTVFLVAYGKLTAEQNANGIFTGEKYEQVMLESGKNGVEVQKQNDGLKKDTVIFINTENKADVISYVPHGALRTALKNIKVLYEEIINIDNDSVK